MWNRKAEKPLKMIKQEPSSDEDSKESMATDEDTPSKDNKRVTKTTKEKKGKKGE